MVRGGAQMVAGWVISKLVFWRDRERKLCSFPEVFCLLQETFAAPNFVLRLDGEFALYAVKALPGRKKLGRWNERGRAIQLWWRREERGRGPGTWPTRPYFGRFLSGFSKTWLPNICNRLTTSRPKCYFWDLVSAKITPLIQTGKEEIEGARIKG